MVHDPILGDLVLDHEGGRWVAAVNVPGATVRFVVGGRKAPDPELLSRAGRIFTDLEAFQDRLRSYLDDMARTLAAPMVAAELRALQLDSIMLAWPDRPLHGMVFFTGASEGREWHCDLVDQEFRDLACDT
jgi:hypothetical protein